MPGTKAERARRHAAEKELRDTLQALEANESRFRMAADGLDVEQTIYEHAALMCRCRTLLRELRGGGPPCPLG